MERFVDIAQNANYQISNLGRVFRKAHSTFGPKGNIYRKSSKELKPYLNVTGYQCICFGGKHYSIHRLIAEAFISNPEGKRTVNHKDGNRANNSLSNLEWATDSENNTHAYQSLGRKSAYLGKTSPVARKTCVTDLNDVLIGTFESLRKAAKHFGLDASHVALSMRNDYLIYGLLKFSYDV